MRRVFQIMYQKRWTVLTYLGIIWILMSILTRNPDEALVLTIYTAPITLVVFLIIVLLGIGD
jgi:hypothetical protein